jgi:hypothetical protein
MKLIDKTIKIKRCPLVVSKKVKGVWVLLESNKQYIRELNAVGGIIWGKAVKGVTIESLINSIKNKYPTVSESIIEKDVQKFVSEYVSAGFLEELK